MKEARFISINKAKWDTMERMQGVDSEALAANFTELSDDLSYAHTFYPGSDTEHYLNQLIGKYLSNIHTGRLKKSGSLWSFWSLEFPRLIAEEHRTMLLCVCFFIVAAVIGAFSVAHDDSFVRLILGDRYVNMTLDNIAAGKPMGVYNNAGEWEMFFHIVDNNVKVSFIVFVFGLFFSVGTLWQLFRNGVMLGAFQYFFYQYGLLGHSSLSVWAHGTFEITAIVIAGGAGLVVGNSFLFPGTYSRLQSFRRGAIRGLKIVVGLIPFFILAGWIESFITRYADAYPIVGFVCIILSLGGVVGYFVLYPYYLYRKMILKHNTDVED